MLWSGQACELRLHRRSSRGDTRERDLVFETLPGSYEFAIVDDVNR